MNFRNIQTILAIIVLLYGCCPKPVEPIQKEINAIADRWAPDKRVAVCDLKLETGQGNLLSLKGETTFPDAKTEVLQLLKNKGFSVTDSAVILPDSARSQKIWGVVALSIANLRGKPQHSSELVSQAIMGTPVKILKQDNGWFLVQTPDRYIAWTNQYAVQPMSNKEIYGWRNADRLLYLETNGTIYQDINKTSVLSDLVAGAIVVKKSATKDLTEVVLPDGRTGFVPNREWTDFKHWKDTVSLRGSSMIATGKRFLGFPYLWGGTSSKAIDCSGFVKTVCFLNGAILERDASQQFMHGRAIDVGHGLGDLQKGDLLFFGKKEPYRIAHVGIYIGDKEVIHSSGYVHISSLDKNKENFSEYLGSGLIGARRIIGTNPEQDLLPINRNSWY